jgi:hypothetical protein
MCGLYSFKRSAEEVRSLFGYAERAEFPPRDYVAPGGPIGIVRTIDGTRHFALVRWGFVPSWASDIKPGKPLINARSESILEKPTFRNAMSRRRCLIPADGFYQWKGDVPGRKQRFTFTAPIMNSSRSPDSGNSGRAPMAAKSKRQPSSPRDRHHRSRRFMTACPRSSCRKISRAGSIPPTIPPVMPPNCLCLHMTIISPPSLSSCGDRLRRSLPPRLLPNQNPPIS